MTLKLSASPDALNLATVRNGLARATLLEDTGVSKPLALPCTDRCVGLRNCHRPPARSFAFLLLTSLARVLVKLSIMSQCQGLVAGSLWSRPWRLRMMVTQRAI